MTKEFCDICGKEIHPCLVERYKLKKQCSGDWEQLTVHWVCWDNLCKEIAKMDVERNPK